MDRTAGTGAGEETKWLGSEIELQFLCRPARVESQRGGMPAAACETTLMKNVLATSV